jgi:hypothetical protein
MSKHDRERRRLKRTAVIHQLSTDLTDRELVAIMREAKAARDTGAKTVTCCIPGYDDAPRELKAIPEAKELCRRMVSLGYPSFLDVTTTVVGGKFFNGGVSLGAWEVWRIARGEAEIGTTEITAQALLNFCEKDLCYMNAVADDHLSGK